MLIRRSLTRSQLSLLNFVKKSSEEWCSKAGGLQGVLRSLKVDTTESKDERLCGGTKEQDFIENADKDKAMAVEELGVENILDRLVCLMESSAKNISDYLGKFEMILKERTQTSNTTSKVNATLEKIEKHAIMFESLRSSVAKFTEANGRIDDKLEMILKEHTQKFEMILKEHSPTNSTTSKVDAIPEKIEKQAFMWLSLQRPMEG